ncbi:calcium-binding protein [Microvirga roseola]|uniref:calcium-binding protein n=1 Tax=Microvirga roseola TaxID=2883126 RepID=UPI001E50F81C|nr:calcium-binding protein [Microvirga roseola]
MAKLRIPTPPRTGEPIFDKGDHILQGGSSADILMISSRDFALKVDGGAGLDWVVFTDGSIKFDMRKSGAQNTGFGTHTITSVENVITSTIGTGRDSIKGNSSKNVIITGQGNDRIDAGGGDDVIFAGTGKDTVTGGAGKDYFVFDGNLNKRTNVDTITDFKKKSDKFVLSRSGLDEDGKKVDIFMKAGTPGVLKKGAFYVGSKAHDKDDRIIYNKKTGVLYYDPDGNGSKAQVEFANLKNKASITVSDFYLA